MKTVNEKYDELLIKIAQSDREAFAALYDLFAPQLMEYTLIKTQDEAVAKDIIHDLFLSLWKNRARMTEIESLPPYLFVSCRYLILTHLRKSARFQNYQDPREFEQELFTHPNIEDRLHYRYLLDIIDEEIENLPRKCQQVFKMSREDHLSNKEIAQELEIAESTVEKHINKALHRLKAAVRTIVMFF